jgi:hypothetical protein
MKLLSPLFIIGVFLLASCSPTVYVSVPVEYSPHKYFPKDSITVVVINRFDVTRLKINNQKKLAAIWAGAYTAIKTAKNQLQQLKQMKVINLVDSASMTVNTDSVNMIARQYKATYVLSLKNFTAGIEMDEPGNSSTFYNTNVSVNFVLYENGGVLYKKLDGIAVDPKPDKLTESLLASISVAPSLGANKAAITTTAAHAAQYALSEYFSYKIAHNRPLYTDNFLMPAVKEIQAQNFEKADTLLRPFLKDKVKDRVSKAAYNLAVAYEARGYIEDAIDMARLSSNTVYNEYATAILYDLKQE